MLAGFEIYEIVRVDVGSGPGAEGSSKLEAMFKSRVEKILGRAVPSDTSMRRHSYGLLVVIH